MLLVLDLGVANSLTNFISEAYAKDDPQHASTYSTTALGATTLLRAAAGGFGLRSIGNACFTLHRQRRRLKWAVQWLRRC
jgi:hypothetical protein